MTREVLVEDAPDDLRLALLDLDPTADRPAVSIQLGNGLVAVRDVAGRKAGERAPFEAAERLVPQIFDVEVRDQALDRERELRALRTRVDAIADAQQRHAEVLELLEDRGRVGRIAADARQVFGDDYIDRSRLDVSHEPFEARAIEAGSGDRVVGVDACGDRVTEAACDELATPAHLVVDARLPLRV
ncbi:MAG TPA: hypothetical protein VGM88_27885 [Kofleriaceae bacterium]